MVAEVWGFTFHIYGLILGLAVLASFEVSKRVARKRGFLDKEIEGLFWLVVSGGIIGARLYHVVDQWKIYSANIWSILYVWNGGLAIWGAVGGGVVGALIWRRLNQTKRSLLEILDVMFVGLPLGQAIGRWGNFFNNEIVGEKGEPLFFYESILNLILFLIILSAQYRVKRTGIVTGVYLLGYGLIRLGLEPLRPETIIWKIGSFPVASIISAGAICFGTFLILKKRV